MRILRILLYYILMSLTKRGDCKYTLSLHVGHIRLITHPLDTSIWSLWLKRLTQKGTTDPRARGCLLEAVAFTCSFRRRLWACPEPGSAKMSHPVDLLGTSWALRRSRFTVDGPALRLAESSVAYFSSAFRELMRTVRFPRKSPLMNFSHCLPSFIGTCHSVYD